MNFFAANISDSCVKFFQDLNDFSLKIINNKLEIICGIKSFFNSQTELDELRNLIFEINNVVSESNRAEFGDFQTNRTLSDSICKLIKNYNSSPEVIIEPTCGKGNFIISALQNFPSIKYIYGIEIYKPYIWETKFAILNYLLNHKTDNVPEINIIHYNIFNFYVNKISTDHKDKNILILGNPPWVTNSKLSSLGSDNLPIKSNFKNHNGIDAITGKGNFDIGEYISLKLIEEFSRHNGSFAFLVKNSVVKNILIEQKRKQYKISDIRQFDIDAKKEFNVSVNACLLYCSLGADNDFTIREYDFYSKTLIRQYGWVSNKFVADTELYKSYKQLDGMFPFEWRQGVKHDLSKIMEFEYIDGSFVNNNEEIVDIEDNLVYGLLKSSDLKENITTKPRKYTIITQNKIGQNTQYIKNAYPKTYKYLSSNIEYFNNRKSSIYKGKPLFSIFGIGNYSFKPYKVAISGFYKKTKFTLVIPFNNKPVMLDDTCYFVGFDNLIEAEITQFLLNRITTQQFVKSISFIDAKRMLTKELLMRIGLTEIANSTSFKELKTGIKHIQKSDWENYKNNLRDKELEKHQQLKLFPDKVHPEST